LVDWVIAESLPIQRIKPSGEDMCPSRLLQG
jgi:hypothetical protein